MENERKTFDDWKAAGRVVKRGERRGFDGKFGFAQTEGRKPRPLRTFAARTCAKCGCRISYGVYCVSHRRM